MSVNGRNTYTMKLIYKNCIFRDTTPPKWHLGYSFQNPHFLSFLRLPTQLLLRCSPFMITITTAPPSPHLLHDPAAVTQHTHTCVLQKQRTSNDFPMEQNAETTSGVLSSHCSFTWVLLSDKIKGGPYPWLFRSNVAQQLFLIHLHNHEP